MQNAEEIELRFCNIDSDCFAVLDNNCPKMKRLNIYNCQNKTTANSNLLFLQRYPTLEHLNYFPITHIAERTDQLRIFLENHTKLKSFSSNFQILMVNRDVLINTIGSIDCWL